MNNKEEIIKWAEKCLLSRGYSLTNPPEHVRTTPWSSVMRFLTSAGYIYLKRMPPSLSLEPVITQILHDKFNVNVPIVIGINKNLNCFLMKDSGNPLRDFFKNNFQVNLLCQGIKKYSDIQIATTEHIKSFLDLGVPDWRLVKLPQLYTQLIVQERLLIDDGMTLDEISLLRKLHHQFTFMCEELSGYKVSETLDHCDFHDNNILIEESTQNIVIIDLGETVIGHPFFSLITCLRNAVFRYSLNLTEQAYLALQDACFENWLESESKNNLLEAISLAEKLWPIYATLGEYRLMASSDEEAFKSLNRRGRLAIGFKEFIKTCIQNDR